MENVMERLGYEANTKLLIINADDFGMCHATNAGIMQLLAEDAVSSASLMVPCGWSKEAATWSAAHPQLNVGIHLTFTSEWEGYKWGPVGLRSGAELSSLIAPDGSFPSECLTVEHQANAAHIRAECIAQIEQALAYGISPSHVDNHMGSLYGLASGRDFLDVVLDVCAQYGLPFRLPRAIARMNLPVEVMKHAQARMAQADANGVVIIDHLVGLPYSVSVDSKQTYDDMKTDMLALLDDIQPGITELYTHPSHVTDELKAITPSWERRGFEFELLRDPDLKQAIADADIRVIRWSDLRDAQRS
ncbi:polysaccharide deacetylase family protein [Paenibacillus sp. 481]|uniref:polysaccharide deacetylase family protein n=1 Tax=Paenibacillus sp. 481 TaxID=2835869 RepID=UPI001E2FFCEC|nr:polysaccharide deacetylase family protein [Paenibacillus sp. 481]UHA72184.1 polysaccharide deacetylase family protein [Paenibacillus sp. 481]